MRIETNISELSEDDIKALALKYYWGKSRQEITDPLDEKILLHLENEKLMILDSVVIKGNPMREVRDIYEPTKFKGYDLMTLNISKLEKYGLMDEMNVNKTGRDVILHYYQNFFNQ